MANAVRDCFSVAGSCVRITTRNPAIVRVYVFACACVRVRVCVCMCVCVCVCKSFFVVFVFGLQHVAE